MKAKWLLLVMGTAVVLSAICFLFIVKSPWSSKRVFETYKYETTMTWSDAPDVTLNPSSLKKLEAELDGIINKEAPGKDLHYPVVSLGKRDVEVMYFGEQDVPEALRKDLDAYIQKRLPELAREQDLADQTK